MFHLVEKEGIACTPEVRRAIFPRRLDLNGFPMVEGMRMTGVKKEALWEQWSQIGWYEKRSSASAAR